MPEQRPAVLFLRVHNAGRSQMAAGWLRHLAGDRVEVFSGGSEPADQVNAAAVAAMAEEGIDIGGEQPQRWTEEHARDADVVITMGCGDVCPVYPGKRYGTGSPPTPQVNRSSSSEPYETKSASASNS